MKRTQIQLPDRLFALAKRLADKKEISLAELVRRGLEYMVATSPGVSERPEAWNLPKAETLDSRDPFSDPNWREQLHNGRLRVAEDKAPHGPAEDT